MPHPAPRLRRSLPAAGALLGLLGLAACGSAMSDGSALGGEARPAAYPGRITLNSEPAGARCVLTNTADGSRVGEVTTPAQVPLARGTAIIEAACSAAGTGCFPTKFLTACCSVQPLSQRNLLL